MFYGRKKEISEIRKALANDRFEAIMLTGRRRVGKSEIIRESLVGCDLDVIGFECRSVSLQDNLKDLSETVASFFSLPSATVFKSFGELFDFVLDKSENRKFVFAIDEFSYLLNDDSTIDSDLAKAINRHKHKSNAKIIVAGSYVRLMQKMIESDRPLYGRFTHIITINPFDYYDSAKFYSNYSDEDKVLMYSAFGGMPYFNSLIVSEESATDNILELIVRRDSVLEHEINEVVLQETGRVNSMNSLISLVASGCAKYADIVNALSSSSSVRPDYALNKLCEMQVLRKEVPINEPNNRKRTFYVFSDNLMHFYYSFVFSNSSKRNIMSPKAFYDKFISPAFMERYVPLKFEEVSKEFLIRKNIAGAVNPPFFNIGVYSANSKKFGYRQFDVVTQDDDGYVSWECKYTNKKVSIGTVSEEEVQALNSELGISRTGFISRSGFTDEVLRRKQGYLHSLAEFYDQELD